MGKLVLGYWNLRGRAYTSLLMLEYADADYEFKRYELPAMTPELIENYMKATADEKKKMEEEMRTKNEWFKEKPTLDMPFVNIPYVIDGDLKVAESATIVRYIARKYNLYGKDEKEKTLNDTITSFTQGVFEDIARTAYGFAGSKRMEGEEFKTMVENYKKMMLPRTLKTISENLGDKTYFVGDEPQLGDFMMFDFLDVAQRFAPETMSEFNSLEKFLSTMKNNSKVKKFWEKYPNFDYPIFSPAAQWGGR